MSLPANSTLFDFGALELFPHTSSIKCEFDKKVAAQAVNSDVAAILPQMCHISNVMKT